MTRQTPVQNRLTRSVDRIAWGLLDLRDRCIARGWWPARRLVAVDASGGRWAIRGTRAVTRSGSGAARAAAVQAPHCVWGQSHLPTMARRALPAAVLEVLTSHAPLPLERMVCAWHAQPTADGGWCVDWGLVPRTRLDALRQTYGLAEDAPVFLLRPDGTAWIARDAAYARWQRRQRWWDAAGILAVGLVVVSAAAVALMPAVLQRQGVVGAMQQLQTLEPQATPIRQQLDALRAQAQVVEEIRSGHASAVPAATIVDALAAALPDDTVLDRIDISGRDIRITGLTPNATDLLSRVAGNALFSDAKAPHAAVRDGATNKERFTFELRWKGQGAS